MSITYEDNTECLNCWSFRPLQLHRSTSRPGDTSRSTPSAPFQKLSLKKHESQPKKQTAQLTLTQHTPNSKTLQSTHYSQQDLYLPLKPQSLHPQFQVENRLIKSKKSLSFKSKNKQDTKASERPVREDLMKQNIRISIDQNSFLAKTTKMEKKGQGQLLEKTRRVIPHNSQTLFQLSKMKNSVLSILGPEERPRLEESTILIDFFHPNSQILQRLSQ